MTNWLHRSDGKSYGRMANDRPWLGTWGWWGWWWWWGGRVRPTLSFFFLFFFFSQQNPLLSFFLSFCFPSLSWHWFARCLVRAQSRKHSWRVSRYFGSVGWQQSLVQSGQWLLKSSKKSVDSERYSLHVHPPEHCFSGVSFQGTSEKKKTKKKPSFYFTQLHKYLCPFRDPTHSSPFFFQQTSPPPPPPPPPPTSHARTRTHTSHPSDRAHSAVWKEELFCQLH